MLETAARQIRLSVFFEVGGPVGSPRYDIRDFVFAAFNHAHVSAVTSPIGPTFTVPGGLRKVRLTQTPGKAIEFHDSVDEEFSDENELFNASDALSLYLDFNTNSIDDELSSSKLISQNLTTDDGKQVCSSLRAPQLRT